MSNPWGGGIGAWALDAERAEEEERERAVAEAAVSSEPAQSFPSLKEANSTKHKKKPVKMSLSQFNTGAYLTPSGAGRPSSEPKRLTPDEMLGLPTALLQRSTQELEHGRPGGGFQSYGSGGGGPLDFPGRRSDDRDSSRGGGGRRSYGSGFDGEERRELPGRDSHFGQPSRADEVGNWGATKKAFAPSAMDYGRQERYSSLESGSGLARADNVDSWSLGKKQPPATYPSFGSGFRDSSASSDSDRWVREGRGAPPSSNGDSERPRLALDPLKGVEGGPPEPARTRPSPFGAARPREEVLKEKGVDWRKLDSDVESKKSSRPTSSLSSRPSSAQSSRPGTPGSQASGAEGARTSAKVNPFGDAKPRQVLLQERGMDWRKIDLELEHRSIDRLESEEEKLLKKEINNLKNVLAKETEQNLDSYSETSTATLAGLREQILKRENQLELLIHELDDKVRFSQKVTTDIRPGSGAGRRTILSDRPSTQSGMSEELRSFEYMERPQSHGGIGDRWSKRIDERRGYRGHRESDFFGRRSMERSKAREG